MNRITGTTTDSNIIIINNIEYHQQQQINKINIDFDILTF